MPPALLEFGQQRQGLHRGEVVHLGRRALAVCHDCGADSGFLPEREAEALVSEHRNQTLGQANTPFSTAVA